MLFYIRWPLGINILFSGDHLLLALHCHSPLRYTVPLLDSPTRQPQATVILNIIHIMYIYDNIKYYFS